MKKLEYRFQSINNQKLRLTKKYKELEKKRSELETELSQIRADLKKEKLKVRIKCERCSSVPSLGKLDLIQDHWYESPYSCSGGDTWHSGEKQFICPKCGTKNRFLSKSKYDKEAKKTNIAHSFIDYDMIDYDYYDGSDIRKRKRK